MIDPTAKLLTAWAKQLPGRLGGHLHRTTIMRWAKNGVKLPDGRVVRLRTIRVGTNLFATEAALKEFLDATNDVPDRSEEIASRSMSARSKATERAVADLVAAGA